MQEIASWRAAVRMEVGMGRTVRFNIFSDRDRTMRRLNALASLNTSSQRRRSIRILKLMEMTSFCKATRPQDKVNGLLGFASRLDSEFDSKALEITQHKTLADVWPRKESGITVAKEDIETVVSLQISSKDY